MDQVLKIISSPVSEHFTGFVAMLVFSFLFYGVFARMREQVCTTICPYGRLQGVLLAKDSIVVAYDYVRGEPRSKKKKGEVYASDTGAVGDCIDCKLCVAVCPTGIDIRNGTQLECTNCTACMDACDLIMDRVDRPAGLIRYDSKTGIEDGRRKIFTPRVWGYTIVLSLLLLLDVSLLVSRGAVESLILRAPGQLYQVQASGLISNLYSFVIINKTRASLPVRLELINAGGEIRFVGEAVDSIPKSGRVEGAFFIDLPASKLKGRKTPLELAVYSNNREIDRVRTNFLGPQ
jgi:cytochrome c oxidase accessory protein FixG